ncbi:C2H2 type zinc finger domain-containing protein [Fusarium napiforme]|uniref:C2H2 type zinc finger domain-containing protein n=1 Tax=Fusarium napiforme TaxID=42672 RepID=A0A8H5I771_9HYPO|nr:C2H2 type zinc finger domain-containing protein [Fusarium napiforme]
MADPGSALDTGSKPFACRICGRQFSRPDSVTRHQRTHSQTEQQQRTQQAQDQQQHQPQDGWPLSPSMSDYTSIQSVMEQNQSITYNPVSDMNEHMFTDPALSNSELDIHLEWPDSEALLQSIVTFDWGSLTLPPGNILTPQAYQEAAGPQPNIISVAQPVGGKENQDPNQLSPVNGSRDAIQSLSDMVTCLSQNVTSAAKSLPELNPAFLDSCLQAYFSHFNIYFPILHRPTFVYRDCSPSLILNAMALGSLFIGTEDAAKGWTALLRHRGPYDSHRGVQLVLTALLGQCYAVMSEKTDLKLTSQVFHSLGFSWAHQNKSCSPRSSEQQPGEISDEYAWKQWAAEEVYHRALVGHYILDGQLSYLSGKPDAATLHAANTLRLSASSKAFEARDPQEWRRIMDDEQSQDPTFSFSDIYHELFATTNPDDEISPCLRSVKASLDVRVVLECLHALVLENREAQSPKSIVKIPALLDVKHALVRVFHLLNDTWSFDENERLELMIRWHFICLDTVCNSMELFDQICRHLQIDQHIFKSRESGKELKDSIQWFRGSTDARCAFLHAAAIQDSVNQLPFNRTNTFWMPMSIFAAYGMYSFSRLGGMASVSVPASIHWESTLIDQSNVGEAMQQDISWKKTQAFISSNMKTTNYGIGPARNLPFEMKKMQTLMRGLASQWGVAVEMVEQLKKDPSRAAAQYLNGARAKILLKSIQRKMRWFNIS